MSKEKNVFVSHYNKDEEHIGKLKDLLAKKGYTLKNSSIDSTKPNQATNSDYIKRLLRLRIHWAGTFICLIGPDTHKRGWVNWEIEQAAKKGKRIIGVFLHGAKDSDIPENLEKYGSGLTGWDSNKIIRGLEGEDIGWCDSNNNPRMPKYSVNRVACQ